MAPLQAMAQLVRMFRISSRHWICGVLLVCGGTGLAGSASEAQAAVIELLDESKFSGDIVHFYDGVFSIQSGGEIIKVPRDKIRGIVFDLPPARAEFASPEKTFSHWLAAMQAGDVRGFIDCYALMYQGLLAAQLGDEANAIETMKRQLETTTFTVEGVTLGDAPSRATLRVLRRTENDSEAGDIPFVKENGEWKMVPPSGPPS